ncbi:MAG TPA: hypothetical protein VJO53_03950 [Candidatus Acidoferrales bacterium]|nr:hypothetical protein [Candidatus Acidoferrales bacterium]
MQSKFLRFISLSSLAALAAGATGAGPRGAAVPAPPAAPAEPCDRACLEGFVNQYLAAIAARDPSKAPFASDVKFTENTAKLKIGQGFWGTANEEGAFKLYFAEPEAGQVGFIGVMKEWDNPVIFCLRLKVSAGKIAEVEDFVVRDANAAKNLDAMSPNLLFLQAVPAAERESREELVKTANMYFSGLQNNDGKGVYPFAADCNRVENGAQTTNNPGAYRTQPPGSGFPILSLGCEAQFKTGFFKIVTHIRERRWVIVDRERGLAFAFAFFDHAGTVKSVTLTGGTTFPSTLRHPLTFEIGELFKIENGKIHAIQAALTQEPYGITSGWRPATPHPAAAAAKPRESAAAACDRKCLNGLVDAYRAALIEHDPSRLPLAANARYTENAQDLKFGDGLWGTLTGWGSYKLYIDDPEEGEAGFVGVTDEAGMSGLLCTRLRVENRKITEVETLITRKETAAGFTRPDGFTDPKIAPAIAGFFQDVPESERESRKDLIAQTDLYFDGIERSSGDMVPFAADVIRVENGTQTCPSSFGAASRNGQPVGCAAGLNSRIFSYIFPISPRRYTVVDRERGIVMGAFMFNTSGRVKSVDVPGVGQMDESPAALRPFSEEVDEIFEIRDGKIDSIIAVMTGLPYGAASGWQ